MVTQYGWGKKYPSKFGDSWDSTMCTEVKRLECVNPGWWHPENTCPSGTWTADSAAPTPLEGTCNDPGCDCVEFFHQAVMIMNGQNPAWFSDYMPTTQSDMSAILSSDFKSVIADS